MSLTIIIFIILIGLIFITIEFFLIPGTTITGIIGGILIVLGIFFAYRHHGVQAGNITLVASGLASFALIIAGFKVITSKKVTLNEYVSDKVNVFENVHIKPGDEGEAFNDLRPNGKGLFNDERIEVYSSGAYIKKGEKIVVVKISGNKIFVKKNN
jgi:membrane-bound ClpP family serine protease